MMCTGADLHVHHWPTVVNDTEINSQGFNYGLGPEDLSAMRQSADNPPPSDIGEAALVQPASVARSWPWTSLVGLGGVVAFGPDHEAAAECRCSGPLAHSRSRLSPLRD